MTLSEVVGEFLLENNFNEAYRLRFTQLGISVLRELTMDGESTPTVAKLHISSVDTAQLPMDYINYIRIAVVGADGELHSLNRNDNINLLLNKDACGNPIPQHNAGFAVIQENLLTAALSVDYIPTHLRNGEVIGSFFNLGGGNSPFGEFRIDEKNGLIHLRGVHRFNKAESNFPNTHDDNFPNSVPPPNAHPLHHRHIILEYLSDLSKVNKNGRAQHVVHPYFIQTLKDGIYWRHIFRNKSYNQADRESARNEYFNSLTNSIARMNQVTLDELKKSYREFMTLTPSY